MKLLVIDDQEPICNIVAQIASQGGWQCEYSTDVGNIVDFVRKEKIDVLLMDYLMPESDGLEVVRRLRQNGEHLPVILFSGLAEEVDLNEAGKLDILQVLPKPIDVSKLRSVLDRASALIAERGAK
jgi:CheY-like chemotaxis protein